MPCLPDGFQLCRTICQALPRPDAMISYRGFGGRPAQPLAVPCPIRDINTTDPPIFRLSFPLCSPTSFISQPVVSLLLSHLVEIFRPFQPETRGESARRCVTWHSVATWIVNPSVFVLFPGEFPCLKLLENDQRSDLENRYTSLYVSQYVLNLLRWNDTSGTYFVP